MNKIFRKIKNIFYSLPFGLKAADTEIMGSNASGDGNDTVINQQVNDKRVAKHLLKGEITQEVEELRYRTYKVDKESKNYEYVGGGMANKKQKPKKQTSTIKFTQENKQMCSGVLAELKNVGKYGDEKYTVEINYNCPVRFKLEQFITFVDVFIKEGDEALTTLRFNDIRDVSSFKSKPFVTELEKLEELFNKNDTYGLSRNDFVTSIICMNFVTYKATNDEPDIVSYGFTVPKLVKVIHENGEFKLTYKWKNYSRTDLSEKFFNAELEEKYRKKEKKDTHTAMEMNSSTMPNYFKKCSKCGKDINIYVNGFMPGETYNSFLPDDDADKVTGEYVCLECVKKLFTKIN